MVKYVLYMTLIIYSGFLVVEYSMINTWQSWVVVCILVLFIRWFIELLNN